MAGEPMPLYRRTPNGPWWVRIGRKTRQTTGTKDKSEAEEFEEILRQRLWRQRKLGDRGSHTWTEASDRWLKSSKRARKRDREFLAWLKPRIGEDAVSSVADPDALEELREDGLAEGWSHSTVDRMMTTVRSVLRQCWKAWKWLPEQPVVPQYGGEEGEPRFLTQEEYARLLKELPQHLRLAARFAVLTLLRKSSQARLTWDRIDLKAQRAWIPGAQMKMHRTHGFPLSDAAVAVLKEARLASPTGNRVFQFEGKPIANFRTPAFLKAAERAGLPDLTWHHLRHTGASWAVQGGCTLQELQVLGDWKSYRSVLRYAFLAPSNAVTAAQRVAQWEHTPKRVRKRA